MQSDPRFATLADRAAHGDVVNGIVRSWTSERTAAEIEQVCIAHDVPVATAYSATEIASDPHFADARRPDRRGRSRYRPGAPAGPLPPDRGRGATRSDRCSRARARTTEKSGASWWACRPKSSRISSRKVWSER